MSESQVWVLSDGAYVAGTVSQHSVDGDASKCVVETSNGEQLTATRSEVLQREPLAPGEGVDQLTTLRYGTSTLGVALLVVAWPYTCVSLQFFARPSYR